MIPFVFIFYISAMDDGEERLEAAQDIINILQQRSSVTIHQPTVIRPSPLIGFSSNISGAESQDEAEEIVSLLPQRTSSPDIAKQIEAEKENFDFFGRQLCRKSKTPPMRAHLGLDTHSLSPIKLSKLRELEWYGRLVLNSKTESIPEENANGIRSKIYRKRLLLWDKQLELLKAKAGQHLIVLPDRQYICCVLHVATKAGLPIMVGLLLERGASKEWKDHLNNVAHYYIHRAEDEDAAVKVAQHLVRGPDDLGPLNLIGETVITLANRDDKKKLLAYYQSIK